MSILSPRLESERKELLPALTRAKQKPSDPNKDLSVYIGKHYKKTIPKRSNKDLGSFQGTSLKKLKLFMVEREKGWNERFVLEQIPDLLEKDKQFLVRRRKTQKYKGSSKLLHVETASNTQNDVSVNQNMNPQKYSSQYNLQKRVFIEQNQQNSHKGLSNQQSHRRLFNNQLKKESILTLLQSRISKTANNSQVSFLKNIIDQLQVQQDGYFSGVALRQFKQLVDCLESANQQVSKRQNKLSQILAETKQMTQLYEKAQTKEEKNKIKQKLLPFLFDFSILTLQVIEDLTAFKAVAEEISEKHELVSTSRADIDFYSQGNYCKKILEDTKQIYDSGIFKGVSYPDPFFVSYPINHIFEERDLVYKIRASQLMLLQEALNN